MKTKSDLERLASAAGATLQEDDGYRDMRVFQIVAPAGQWWLDGSVRCIRVEWATGRSPHAIQHNEAEWLVASEAVACGLEPIPADELYLYAED